MTVHPLPPTAPPSETAGCATARNISCPHSSRYPLWPAVVAARDNGCKLVCRVRGSVLEFRSIAARVPVTSLSMTYCFPSMPVMGVQEGEDFYGWE